ncbi:MAG TPA: TonB C-terminal domain-containing protein [Myxococcaceae bacterium]|nr:TonB C-terminal domain-containing protein [Myxococcaceae bacterium]
MTPRRPAHRWPFLRALAVSLLLHAALVLWLLRSVHPAQVPAPRPLTRITLRPLPPRPVPDRAAPHPPAPPHRPGAPSSPGTASRPSTGDGKPAPPSSAPTPTPPRTPPPDAPIQLFPGGAVARGAGPVPPGDPGASTAPDHPDSPEDEGKRVLERVETMRRDGLAERLVATGVDDYFKDYRRALQSHMGPPPPGGGPKHGDLTPGQRWINAWLAALEEANSGRDPPKGERMPARDVQDVTGRMDEFIANQLGPMAVQPSFAAQRLIQRASAGEPVAVLRIVQRADGSIASTELVASSGDKAFDAYVVEHAALALAAVPPPPARQGAGLHPDGTRTEWAFYRAGAGCGVFLLRVY